MNDPARWRPPWRHLPRELRALFESAHSRLRPPDMRDWPRGDGLPVLVIPGFGQNERSTAPLRAMLGRQGFAPLDWAQGRNTGMQRGMTSRLLVLLESARAEHGQAAAIIGWSLGGVFARELARKAPERVSRVITLGSPIGGPHATTLQPLFARLNPASAGAGHDPERYRPPPVPCTAIYTRQDGIVAWRSSIEPEAPNTENIEVRGSHMGLGFNPAVWYAICHRLSPQTRGQAFAWPGHRLR